jgi:hypothetical protein
VLARVSTFLIISGGVGQMKHGVHIGVGKRNMGINNSWIFATYLHARIKRWKVKKNAILGGLGFLLFGSVI